MINRSKKKRIMHGLSEVAGQNYYAVQGLRKLGIDASTVVWQPHPLGLYSCDISLGIDRKKRWLMPWYAIKLALFFVYALFRYNVFHFHFGRSILINTELWLYDLLHKFYLYEFHGSDLRNMEVFNRTSKVSFPVEYKQLSKQIRRNQKICKKAKTIILHDNELIPYLSEPHGTVQVVPLRINLERFVPQYPSKNSNGKIRIVHAPSKRDIKGTAYVIRAVEKLKKKYQEIEFVLVENLPLQQAMGIYATADIIVDQLVLGVYGVFSIECMALGKPVITYIAPEMVENYPAELPIITADIDTIEAALERLILDGNLRRELGIAGRKYVETYHDYRVIAHILEKIYSNELQPLQGRQAFLRVKAIKEEETIVAFDNG